MAATTHNGRRAAFSRIRENPRTASSSNPAHGSRRTATAKSTAASGAIVPRGKENEIGRAAAKSPSASPRARSRLRNASVPARTARRARSARAAVRGALRPARCSRRNRPTGPSAAKSAGMGHRANTARSKSGTPRGKPGSRTAQTDSATAGTASASGIRQARPEGGSGGVSGSRQKTTPRHKAAVESSPRKRRRSETAPASRKRSQRLAASAVSGAAPSEIAEPSQATVAGSSSHGMRKSGLANSLPSRATRRRMSSGWPAARNQKTTSGGSSLADPGTPPKRQKTTPVRTMAAAWVSRTRRRPGVDAAASMDYPKRRAEQKKAGALSDPGVHSREGTSYQPHPELK